MDKIKSVFGKVSSFVKKKPKEFLALGVFVVALSIYLITNAFAALTPTKSVIITSEKTSYEENEPGSWQVEKSGKWISKGRARINFDVDTTLMTEDKDTDIIFVLDISGSMSGDKLEKVKEDSIELIDSLLSNKNNSAALITFDTGSTIVSNFTNDKDYLINQINSLKDTGSTNYYQPLVNVDNILKDYVKSDDKEVIVLFLTDGYPNVDTPNQIAQYETLKKTYPYITINGIQYEMGDTILNPIKEISDNQFHADMETLNNVLFDASVAPIPYDEFKIVDYIDNRYFKLNSEDDITVSEGSVKLEEENGKQKITWTIPYFKSGRDAKLSMDIVLKDEYIGQGGIYPTNESEEIISKIDNNPDEEVTSTKTPVLSDNYKVIYDGNAPDGSSVSNVPSSANYSVFDTVSISTEEPSCVGYEFKGWEITNKDVTRVNDDHFIMPEKDVVIKAKWSKVEVAKSMDGTVNDKGDPIMKSYRYNSSTDYHSSTYKSKITSIVTKDNIEIPASAIEYWDVSSAGDGSVIAYIEDDGRGDGTYKVTIGGQGWIIANSNSSYLFYGSSSSNGFSSLETIDLTYLDTSQVTYMSYMFGYCSSLTSLDVSNFDTSNVTDMSSMFSGCSSLTSLDVSNFDTSNVTNMSNMFYNCSSLTSLDLSSFDTSNVTSMGMMFEGCHSLTSLNLSNFETLNVTSMYGMFWGCSSLTSLDLSNFDTSNVTNMSYIFYNCRRLTSLDVSHFDTSNVTNMKDMFYNCSSLTSLDISHFNTSNVTNMSDMFYNCSSLTSLDLGNFDTSNVTNMSDMFYNCRSLTSLDLSNFDTTNVTDMSHMFYETIRLDIIDVTSFNTSKVTNMSYMFAANNYVGSSQNRMSNLDVSNFDTSNVTNMSHMFWNVESVSLDVSNFDTSNVTNMSDMFYGCSRLTSIDLSNFDTSNVTNMSMMFSSCSGLTSLDIGNFDTTNVTSMSGMFWSCISLTSLDIGNFDTSNVTNMSNMFQSCSSLTNLDMRDADFNSVTSYNYMFYGAKDDVGIIVKDSEAEGFIKARLDEYNLSNATVTIANAVSQTSLFEIGPREFGPFVLL